MILRNPLPLALLLIAVPGLFAATRETDLPDKEMLKMMEFLREMEMVKHMEMMRELDRAEVTRRNRQDPCGAKTASREKEGDLQVKLFGKAAIVFGIAACLYAAPARAKSRNRV